MASYPSTQQIQALLSFPFRDPQWKRKFGIAYVIMLLTYTIILIPISIFLDGYVYRIMKRIITENGEPYLPEWEDWKGLFNDGLKLFIPRFILSLPILLISLAVGVAVFFGTFKLFQSIPNDPTIVTSQPMFPIVSIVIFLLFFGGAFIYSFALGFLLPVLMSHIVAKGQMTAIFRVREWWKIYKANFSGFLLAFFIPMIIAPVISLPINFLSFTIVLSFLIPFIIPVISVFIYIYSNTIYAQAYAVGIQRLAHVQSTENI